MSGDINVTIDQPTIEVSFAGAGEKGVGITNIVDNLDGTFTWTYGDGATEITTINLKGADGIDGTDGKEVEFQKSATHIQRRYVGDVSWINLVALTDITGPKGDTGGINQRIFEIKIMDDTTALTTGDGKFIFCIPQDVNGYNLTQAQAFVTTVSSSGLPTVQIRNVTDSFDMLTTPITIDVSGFTSYVATTPPVIDIAHDDVATGDLIAIDIDGAGTGAKGLGVILTFTAP